MRIKLFCFLFLVGIGSQLHADFFDMETESDMSRIAGSFIGFYSENYDYLREHSADLKKCKEELFRSLSLNGSIFTTLYRLDPNGFRKNFFELRTNIIKDIARWKDQLGEPSFGLFISGVYYLQKVFF